MMAGIMKSPPDWDESRSYEDYKKEVQIWQLLKVCEAKEEGPMLFRTLKGKAKDAALKLDVDKIGSNDGVKNILEKLDKLYLEEKNTRMYTALEKFEQYSRPSGVSIPQFINDFEELQSKVKEYKIEYPVEVLGFKLLKAAGLSSEKEDLVKATIETGKFNYDTVVEQLKKVCGANSGNENLPIGIKQEKEVFYGAEGCNNESANQVRNNDSDYAYYGYPLQKQNRGNPRNFNTRTRYGRFNNQQQFRGSYQPRYPPPQPKFGNTLNPTDTKGNLTKCRKCKCIYHWLEDCPHASPQEKRTGKIIYNKNNTFLVNEEFDNCEEEYENGHFENNNEQCLNSESFYMNMRGDQNYQNDPLSPDVYIGLFQQTDPVGHEQMIYLVGESLDKGIIDSGCPKTVCGLSWYNNFKETLNEEEKSTLNMENSSSSFRFGDSPIVKSLFKVMLPLSLKNIQVRVPVEVVKSDVPLLLSKGLMQSGKAIMDYEKDTVKLFGVEQPLINLNTGHYAIDIKHLTTQQQNERLADVILLAVGEPQTLKEIKQTARKLHIQFNHAPGHRLIKLLKDAGSDEERLVNEIRNIENNCNICKVYKKTPSRPVVTFPLAREFNEVIQLDLKTYTKDKVYLFHIIDHATRFSVASVIYSKKKEVIVAEFFKNWVALFGYPQKLLVDNGGEFINADVIDMCENLNISMKTTAAESAWSNGLCEKYNGVIGEAVRKVREEVKCSLEIALAWCVNAKNSLHTVHGFSPYQMVFGRNPNLPFVLNNKPPALEGVTSSEIVRSNLNAIHKARQEFIKMESCEKIRRALRARMRTYDNIKYLPGDSVYFKRDGEDQWKGPAKVICQEGSKVLIKCIGKSIISVHTCRLQLANETLNHDEKGQHQRNDSSPTDKKELYDLECEQNESSNLDQPPLQNEESIIDNQNVEQNELSIANNDPIEFLNTDREKDLNTEIIPPQYPENENNNQVNRFQNSELLERKDLPEANQHIKYKLKGDSNWNEAKVLSRGGKSTGANKFWLNIQDLKDDKQIGLDWKQNVEEWEILEENVLFLKKEDLGFEEAKKKELNSWKDMNVYTEVKDVNQPLVSVRWVFTKKIKNGQEERKARLVARGYEETDENIQKESPTCLKENLRLGTLIISSLGWQLNSIDIKCAFLQGKKLERDIHLRPPKEVRVKGIVWKLNQCVYGLKEASRYWYLRIFDVLTRCGCKCSKLDPAIFYYYTDCLEGLIICHVDDFLFGGSPRFAKVITYIKENFKISREDSVAFKYVGLNIQQCKNGVFVGQPDYIKELEEIPVTYEKRQDINALLKGEDKENLRSLIGQLNWISTQTRPDLSYNVCSLSNSYKVATVETLLNANKVVRKAKQSDCCLFLGNINFNNFKLVCYTDAAHGNLADGGSQGGLYVEIVSGSKHAPIHWESKRIRRVVKSSMAAEILALVEGVETAMSIRNTINEILFAGKSTIIIEAITDSKSVFDAAYSTNQILDKGQRINISLIREAIGLKEVQLKWVSSNDQLANALTKATCESSKIMHRVNFCTKYV